MRHIWPTAEDMLNTLPPGELDELLDLIQTAAEGAHRGWLPVPAAVWEEFAARVTGPR